jgi:hypothetical protein
MRVEGAATSAHAFNRLRDIAQEPPLAHAPGAARDASYEPGCMPDQRSQLKERVTIRLTQAQLAHVDRKRRRLSRAQWLLHGALGFDVSGPPQINCDAWSKLKELMDFARQILANPTDRQCCEKTAELASELLQQVRELRDALVGVHK